MDQPTRSERTPNELARDLTESPVEEPLVPPINLPAPEVSGQSGEPHAEAAPPHAGAPETWESALTAEAEPQAVQPTRAQTGRAFLDTAGVPHVAAERVEPTAFEPVVEPALDRGEPDESFAEPTPDAYEAVPPTAHSAEELGTSTAPASFNLLEPVAYPPDQSLGTAERPLEPAMEVQAASDYLTVAPQPEVREITPDEYHTASASGIAGASPVVAHQSIDPSDPETNLAVAAPAPEELPGHPNWMLAFVSLWAGITAGLEAWATASPGFKSSVLLSSAFLGYSLLTGGLLGFALEALQWGRRRNSSVWTLWVIIPAILTLLGVVFLIRSNDPGRRI